MSRASIEQKCEAFERRLTDYLVSWGLREGCLARDIRDIFRVHIGFDLGLIPWRVQVRVNYDDHTTMCYEQLFDDYMLEFLMQSIGDPESRALLGIQSIEGEIARAKLHAHFPRAIRRIERIFSEEKCTHELIVVFINGHRYKCASQELFSTYSLATMGMLYDLPDRGNVDGNT